MINAINNLRSHNVAFKGAFYRDKSYCTDMYLETMYDRNKSPRHIKRYQENFDKLDNIAEEHKVRALLEIGPLFSEADYIVAPDYLKVFFVDPRTNSLECKDIRLGYFNSARKLNRALKKACRQAKRFIRKCENEPTKSNG